MNRKRGVVPGHPFAHKLEVEAGARYSDYSTSGGQWTWQIGGQWIPVEGLRLRGSLQQAVRAPNIGELLEAPSSNQAFLSGEEDFCLATNDPVQNGLTDVCIAQGINPAQLGIYDIPPGADIGQFSIPVLVVSSGNPDLEPERAETLTAGIDFEHRGPISLPAGASYFQIELRDAITALDRPLGVCAIINDPNSPVRTALARDPSGFPQTAFDQPINIAVANVNGVDFNFDLSTDAPNWMALGFFGENPKITLRSLATRYTEFGSQPSPVTPFLDCAGGFSRSCSTTRNSTYPDFLANTTLSLDANKVVVALRWRYIGPIENVQPQFDAVSQITRPPLAVPRVGDRNYLDVSFRFDIGRGNRLRAGIDNLLKTSAPLLGNQASQSNTDPGRHDIYGRRFFVGLTAQLGQ